MVKFRTPEWHKQCFEDIRKAERKAELEKFEQEKLKCQGDVPVQTRSTAISNGSNIPITEKLNGQGRRTFHNLKSFTPALAAEWAALAYDKDPEIAREFSSKESFVAYAKAEASGLIKLHGATNVRTYKKEDVK